MNIKFIKEKHKYMIPVDTSKLIRGTWSNATRHQVVNIYNDTVEYKWDGCKINKFHYIKSKEHFLRSYNKI